jgi:hypothetical protein
MIFTRLLVGIIEWIMLVTLDRWDDKGYVDKFRRWTGTLD